MKIKTKFYLSVVIIALSVIFLFVNSIETVAVAAEQANNKNNKGGGVSAQATAGDVPPIVMTPHGGKKDLVDKLIKAFNSSSKELTRRGIRLELSPSGFLKYMSLRGNFTSSAVGITDKDAEGFFSKDFYITEAKKFLAQNGGLFGTTNLDKNVKVVGFKKNKKSKGYVSVYFNIYIHGFLFEGPTIRVGFVPDGSVGGMLLRGLTQITPEMYRAVKAAKNNVKSLEEIKILAGEKAGITPNYEHKYREPKVVVIDKEPYLLWVLYWSGMGTERVRVNAVTGEIYDKDTVDAPSEPHY